jgi:hypothetical protein
MLSVSGEGFTPLQTRESEEVRKYFDEQKKNSLIPVWLPTG